MMVINWYENEKQEDWYNENYVCSQYVDEDAIFPEIGGCRYDFPVGDCMDVDVNSASEIRGCAAEMENHLTSKVFQVRRRLLCHGRDVICVALNVACTWRYPCP